MFHHLLAWSFVWMVTVFDAGFAWVHRQTFSQWEMNPLAVAIAEWGGPVSVVGFRVATVAFGCVVVSLVRKQVRDTATRIVAGVHIGLLLVYVVGFAG